MNIKKLIYILKTKIKSSLTRPENIPDWVKQRRDICNTCPLNSKHSKNYLEIEWWKWFFLNMGKDFCTLCGCGIKSKTFSEIEKCQKGKWDSVIK